MPRNPRDRRYWLRMLGWSIVSAVAAVVIFSGATWETPWRRLVEPFLVSMVFTVCIVPLAAFIDAARHAGRPRPRPRSRSIGRS